MIVGNRLYFPARGVEMFVFSCQKTSVAINKMLMKTIFWRKVLKKNKRGTNHENVYIQCLQVGHEFRCLSVTQLPISLSCSVVLNEFTSIIFILHLAIWECTSTRISSLWSGNQLSSVSFSNSAIIPASVVWDLASCMNNLKSGLSTGV